MTKKFMTRALTIVGLLFVGSMASYAQTATYTSTTRRVALDQENKQPVAASAVIMDAQGGLAKGAASLNLSDAQRTQIGELNREVAALHSERAQLWSAIRTAKASANYNDDVASAEVAPRMTRIVAINSQLASIVARQDRQMASILTPAQRTEVSRMVNSAKASF
jgi:Spy/CpxP family protein refolding chaperone